MINEGLVYERQKQLSEILIAALTLNPQMFSAVSFLEPSDVAPQYVGIFKSLELGGAVDTSLFEQVYSRGQEGLKALLLEHEKIELKELVSIAKTLQGVSRRMSLASSLERLTSKLDSLPRQEILMAMEKLAEPFREASRGHASADEINMMTAGTGESTCYFSLDRMTSGIGLGEFWVFAARPSVGKSAFAINMALRMLLNGRRVLYDNLEMNPGILISRMLSALCGVDAKRIRDFELNPDELLRAGIAAAILAEHSSRFFLVRESNPFSLRAVVEAVQPNVVFVDHMQLMSAGGNGRNEEITIVSKALQDCSHVAPLVALSQLTRSPDRRDDHRPVLSDLRDSGSIEQDASVVIFLTRPNATRPGAESADAVLEIAKNRNGPIGYIEMCFIKPFQLFVEKKPVK